MSSTERILGALKSEQRLLADGALNSSDHSSEAMLVAKGKFQGFGRAIELIEGLVEDEKRRINEVEVPEFA